jgi:penicillin-binding protein 1B
VRDALIHSLNVATVKVAEMVGYQRVVDLARQMGLGTNIQPTPAVALGAYEMTPIDVAAGYTAFAAGGVRAEPLFIRSVVSGDGKVEESAAPSTRPVLDPRVAYLTTSLMEDVINHGTGFPVRQLGFDAPAAGKTGTSRDGWFAGYTSNLLCVVWVGFDDNRDLGLAGGAAAAPVWAEFMKRAVALPMYRNTQDFEPPAGIVQESVDLQSGLLATASCPNSTQEYFIAGSEPTQYCDGQTAQASGGNWLSHLFGKEQGAPPEQAVNTTGQPLNGAQNQHPKPSQTAKPGQNPSAQGDESADEPPKKKGLLDRIFGIFGGSKQPDDNSKTKPQQ